MNKAIELHEYLSVLATTIVRGDVDDADAMKAVVETAAKGVAKRHPNVSADEFIANTPKKWLEQPNAGRTVDEARYFLNLADVFGVDMTKWTALSMKCQTTATEANLLMAANKAARAWQNPSAAERVIVDAATMDVPSLSAALVAVCHDANFQASLGGTKYARAVKQFVAREAETAAFQIVASVNDQGRTEPKAQVFAGGRPVQDPRDLPFVLVARRPLKTTAGELATAVANVFFLREAIDEEGVRSAILGKEAGFGCGRVPTESSLPVVAKVEGQEIVIGFGLDVPALREYQDGPGDDAALAGRMRSYLDGVMVSTLEWLKKRCPIGVATDATYRSK